MFDLDIVGEWGDLYFPYWPYIDKQETSSEKEDVRQIQVNNIKVAISVAVIFNIH